MSEVLHPKTGFLRTNVRHARSLFNIESLNTVHNDIGLPGYRLRRVLIRSVGRNKDEYGNSVLDYLPLFHGQNLVDILDEKTALASCDQPVRVLDIGSGQNQTLKDIEDRYKDRVKTYGLDPAIYTQSAQIAGEVIKGDVSRINTLFSPGFFDVIYSCRALNYSGWPMVNLYPKIYSVLREDGIALLDSHAKHEQFFCTVSDFDAFNEWLVKQGYDIEFESSDDFEGYYSLGLASGSDPSFEKERSSNTLIIESAAFRRTKPRLRLPVTYVQDGVIFDPLKAKKLINPKVLES